MTVTQQAQDDAVLAAPAEDAPQDAAPLTLDELFARNMATLQARVPELYNQLKDHQPISKVVILDNGEPCVDFQNVRQYPKGAMTEAALQVADLRNNATRLSTLKPEPDSLDEHSRQAYLRVLDRLDKSGLQFATEPAWDSSYFLIVFGVGLGQHLDALIEKTKCRSLILVEPNRDFIYHSLYYYDWTKLIERMQERGSLEFLLYSDTALAAHALQSIFRAHNPTGMDGTYLFRHYKSAIFNEIERELRELLRTSLMGLGFFQDEVNMIGHTYKNLQSGKARMVSLLDEPPGVPAFVIGTGPSLDGLLDFIKENQDRAVIFACGTAIDPLMARGIQPDFWVMMERDPAILPQAEETAEMFDVSEVRYAGSTTIYPGVPDFFKEAIFFFRPGLSPMPLFAQDKSQVARVPDPLAANAGLSFALHIGFREFYFLGVDVGSKFKDRGHAKNSWYERHNAENINLLGTPLPGNFGGTVYTTSVLQWSKETLEKLTLTSPGRAFYNLGDGALIKGATPKHPKAVKLTKPKRSKKDIVDALVAQCPVYTAETFQTMWDNGAIIDRLPEFCERVKQALLDDDMDDRRYGRDLAFLLESNKSQSSLPMLLRGSVFLYGICLEYYQNRAKLPEERTIVRDIFKEEFVTLVDTMCQRATDVFLGLENNEPWEEFTT
jgi:hypothetical protein